MRRKMGGTAVKRAIIVAMVAMLTISQPMMTYASENTQTVVDDHGHDGDVATHVKSTDGEYTDTAKEAQTVHDSAASVKDMEAQVQIAQNAAQDAGQKVQEIQKAVSEVKSAANTASSAADTANSAVGSANAAAGSAAEAATDTKSASDGVNNLIDKTTKALPQVNGKQATLDEAVSAYNDTVAATQASLDKINAGKSVSVPGEGTVLTEDYVKKQAQIAEDANKAAKAALEAAIAVDTTVVNQEVKDHVQDAVDAASTAQHAADNAESAYDAAKANYLQAIAQYNAQAGALGEATIDVSVLSSEEKAAYDGYLLAANKMLQPQKSYTDQITAGLTNIENAVDSAEDTASDAATKLTDAAEQIQNATIVFNTAEKDYDKAKSEAESALQTAQLAQKKLKESGDDKIAQGAADKVSNYYVTPAATAVVASEQNVLEQQRSVSEKQQALSDAGNTYSAAVAAAQQAGKKNYQDQVDKYQSEIDQKKNALSLAIAERSKASGFSSYFIAQGKVTKCEAELKAANMKMGWFQETNSEDEYAADAVKNSEDVKAAVSAQKAAKNNLDAAQGQLKSVQNQLTADQNTLAAATATRDDYLTQINAAYQTGATQGLIDAVNQEITDSAVKINQVEFDKDLNEWANGFLNTADFDYSSWSKYFKSLDEYKESLEEKDDVQDYIDETYDINNAVKKFFNDSQAAQWMISTKDTNKVMQAVSNALKAQIVKKYEYMATANANFANLDTQKAYHTADSEVTGAQTAVTEIKTIKGSVTEANENLIDAQTTYNRAKTQLDAVKKDVDGLSLSKVNLAALNRKIADAKEALATAKEELGAAHASALAAENYSNWAQALIKDQNALVYVQTQTGADGNAIPAVSNVKGYDTQNQDVKSRSTSDFVSVSDQKQVIPYTIYRAFVAAMYDKYSYSDVEKTASLTKGKGAALGTETQSVVFWEVNSDNQLTGKYYQALAGGAAPADMPNGTYFIGYTVKHEGDGYHMDGTMYRYTQPVPQTETTTTTTTTSTVTTTTAATIIAEAATPLAATPAVLGARRAPSVATVETAATAQTPAVLGAARSRATGDSTHDDLRLMITLAGAAGAAGLFAAEKRKKAQKKEQ